MWLWFWVGIAYLGILTYQDIMHSRMVDSRHNYFMTGYTVALGWLYHHVWWYILTILLVVMGLQMYFNKVFTQRLGAADAHTIGWVMIGLAFINVWSLLTFLVILSLLTIAYVNVSKWYMEKKLIALPKVAFYPVLFCTFLLTGFITGIWNSVM